ncbi:MAG: alpha/beta fold hydrolase [Flavobacteriaceae bacterium]
MTLDQWKADGHYFSYKHHAVFVREAGQGEPLLLIHGFPTASWDWHRLWPQLIKNYRVIALDLLGFGFSAKPRNYPYSILDQADLIEQLLAHKGIASCSIISHDYGDTVAQELLARFNERHEKGEKGLLLHRLCLLNGGLFPETHRPLLVQKVLMSPLGPIVSRLFNRKKLGKNFRRIFGPNTQPTEAELDDFWTLIEGNGGRYVFHLLIRYMAERLSHRERWVKALQTTTIPLRLINGTADPISGQHMVDRYRELIPNPDVVELPQIGHFPLLEAPKAVLEGFRGFVTL